MSDQSQKKLTEKQQAVLEFIATYTAQHNRPPTLREIAVALDMASHTNALWHVNVLIGAGFVERIDDGSTRNLKVVKTYTPQEGVSG